MITESLEDFRKRYKGTYLFLNFKGQDHLVRYDSDNEEDFCFFSPNYGDLLVDEDTARTQIKIKFPKPGLYNIQDDVYEFTRNPLRQWKRAPCSDNSRLILITSTLTREYQYVDLTHQNVSFIFFPKYPNNLDTAIKELKTAIALNQEFGITKHTEENIYILWYHCNPIGFVYPKTRTITVKYTPLYQEVIDFFKKKEYTWIVTPKQ